MKKIYPITRSNKEKYAIVTGGTGFVGSHLLYHLAKKGTKIYAIKRPSSSVALTERVFAWYAKYPNQLLSKINWADGDITDRETLIKVFKKGSIVYHVAGLVSFNPKDKEELTEINAKGTENVVNAALETGIEKLCHVSSISAIERDGSQPITDEETPWDNSTQISAYGRSKYAAEREVWRGIAEGLKAVIVNPTIILGPGNWEESSVKIFQTVYKGLTFYTKGTNGYVDVNDLAQTIIMLMESDIEAQRFIINSENISYQKLFTLIAQALNVPPPKYKAGKFLSELVWRTQKLNSIISGKTPLITKETARTANSIYQYSNDKIVTATGIKFKPIRESIEQTAKIFLQEIQKEKTN